MKAFFTKKYSDIAEDIFLREICRKIIEND